MVDKFDISAEIEIAVVGYIDNLICPVVHKQEPRGAVAIPEPVNIAHRPATDCAFAGYIGITADGAQALAFCHSIANHISKSTGVIRLCHFYKVARNTA
jgi:hypothetical protein